MPYKMTDSFKGDLKSLLMGVFKDEELNMGIKAFENLINIPIIENNFDQSYGKMLNESDLKSTDWDMKSVCRVEEFLKKIARIKDTFKEDTSLWEYYKQLGFDKWLDDPDIKRARALDPANKANAGNLKPEEGGKRFNLRDADAAKYKGCQHHFSHYIVAYQLRNEQSHEGASEVNYGEYIDKVTSLFVVYIDQCIRNRKLINDKYESIPISSDEIDYAMFAQHQWDLLNSFKFIQLDWCAETDNLFEYDFQSSVKFIGEAGIGKTTQMKNMFKELLRQVLFHGKKILPVWLNLADFVKNDSLEGKIRESLGEYESYYPILLKKNAIALFLDGYNEALIKDEQDSAKRILAMDIDEIHNRFPEVLIAMTDRRRTSNPPCLQKNVSVYTFNGLNRKKMIEYVKKVADSANQNNIITYLNSENSSWLGDSAIPAQMNMLIDLLSEGITPEDESDFYDQYLDYVFYREANEKKETRIGVLKYLLSILTFEMNDSADGKTQFEIVELWLSKGHVKDTKEAMDLFTLAIELPVLVPGSNDKTFIFAHKAYYHKMQELYMS